jgi:hypothetical protein
MAQMEMGKKEKSYDMGPPALLPIREEGVLRIFIALKCPSPWLGAESFCNSMNQNLHVRRYLFTYYAPPPPPHYPG